MTQRASYTSGLFFGALSFGSMLVLGLGSSVALARVYGVEVIGEYAILLGAMMIVNLLSTLREQEALVRDIARFDRRDPAITGRFYAILAFSVGLTIVAAVVVSVASTFILPSDVIDRPNLVWPAIAIIAGYAMFDRVAWNVDVVLSAFRAGQELFWGRLVQAVILVGVAVPLGLIVRQDVWGLVIATLAAWAVALGVRVVYLRRFMRFRIPREELAEGAAALPGYLRFGLKAGGGAFSSAVATTAPVWVLAPLAPIAIVGAWSRVETLTARLIDGLWRVSEMLYPTLVERREAGDIEGSERVLLDSIRYVVGGTCMVAAALGGASLGVMNVFGPGFDAAAGALAVILLAAPLQAVTSMQQITLYSVDRPLASTVAAVVRMVLVIVLGIAFVIAFGVVGIAIAVVISLIVSALIQGWQLRSELTAPFTNIWPRRSIAVVIIAYGLGFVASLLIDRSGDGHLITLLALIVGTLAYLAAYVSLGGLLPADRIRIRQAIDRMRGGPDRPEDPGEAEPEPEPETISDRS